MTTTAISAASRHNSNITILRSISGLALLFVIAGCLVDPPANVVTGLAAIITSRDTLVTDYIGTGGLGAAMVNAGLLTLIVSFIYARCNVRIGGASVACLFLMLGFGLFGKNLLNIWCVVLGVWLYSRFRRERFAAHLNTAFFGTALGPIFSEILFSTCLPLYISIPLSVATSLAMGFVLAPVAADLSKAHMGLSLYNIGFASGIAGTVVVALYKSYGFVPDPVFIWTTGDNMRLAAMLAGMFLSMIGLGLIFDRTALAKQTQILAQSGQAPTDFVSLVGIGPTFLNMGFTGMIGVEPRHGDGRPGAGATGCRGATDATMVRQRSHGRRQVNGNASVGRSAQEFRPHAGAARRRCGHGIGGDGRHRRCLRLRQVHLVAAGRGPGDADLRAHLAR